MRSVAIQQFEGPLDLLLQLIEREQLPITEISLSQITEQYSQFVFEGGIPVEEVADYIVIASKLLLIKSRSLLPQLEVEEESEGATLVEQLKLYQQYHQKTELILGLWNGPDRSYPRLKTPIEWHVSFRPPSSLSIQGLWASMHAVVASIVGPKAIMKSLIDRAITLQQKMNELVQHITQTVRSSFGAFIKNRSNRTEMIVSFLALLELVKRQSISIKQSDLFSDMTIEKV